MASTSLSVEYLSIFESKSARVKGLAFHATRPWLLASLHTGTIQLWDYRVRTLVDKFTEHDGPVRSVDFHPQQPMFVSGGDDHKIRVWSYKERRCLFTLTGHLDYIRSVQFHHEYPWILSCADDQTVRVWNWQSRQCIAVLAGHSHYVMSARFHPSEDLVVSASLDQTVRVWDISSLRKKSVMPSTPQEDAQRFQQDLFGGSDAQVRFVLEGHERGVNWAAFHPTMPLIISGADDRSLKLWRMNETKAWEVDTLRGHFNNVSCALFHPRQDALLSLSEDKTLRVWDLSKRVVIHTHRREHERFWYLTAHPRLNLFAAAHDTGLVMFKLQHERPPYALAQGSLLFVKDRFIRQYETSSQRDVPVIALRSKGAPRELLYSARDGSVIVTSSAGTGDGDGGIVSSTTLRYELYTLPKSGTSPESVQSSASGGAMSVAWVKRQRFAALVKNTLIHILAPNGEVIKKITPPHSVDALLSAPLDCLLLRSEDRVSLFDVQQERVLAELKVAHVKAAYWQDAAQSPEGPYVALLCRGAVVIANRKLERLLSVPETLRLKSGAWDEQGVFLYTTAAHLKFALPPPPTSKDDKSISVSGNKGDAGIVRTLDRPIYLVAANSGKAVVTILDRTAKVREVPIDVTEYAFKRALALKRYDEVLRMVRGKALIGKAIVGYLERAGHPELALHFVQDPATRFELALAASHAKALDTALAAAQSLHDPTTWRRLASAALAQGEAHVAEKSLQQTLDFERLSLLYFASGQQKNLSKMLAIAQSKRHDPHATLFNSLLVGDVEARVRVLEQSGQPQLAYVLASSHGLIELAQQLLERIPEQERPPEGFALPHSPLLMQPPVPLLRSESGNVSWPHTRAQRSPFDALLASGSAVASASSASPALRLASAAEDATEEAAQSAWGNDDLELSDGEGKGDEGYSTPKEAGDAEEPGLKEGDGWAGDDLELDLEEELEKAAPKDSSAKGAAAAITLPTAGTARPEQWARASNLAADLVAAGQIDQALRALNEQIGLVNAAPLKATSLQLIRARAALLPMNGGLPPLRSFLERSVESARDSLPKLALSLASQIEKLGSGYKAFTSGAFTEALEIFRSILHAIPLLVVSTRQEANEVKEMVTICREYITGIATELKRKDLVAANAEANATRALELAALFTHVQLQPKHQQLVLKLAMNAAAKAKNYSTADDFARRLLDTSPPQDVQELCEKVLRLCESKGLSDALKLNYDSRNPFVICAGTLVPIFKGSPSSSCPYCAASFIPTAKGRRCTVCQLSEIGKTTTGLQSLFVVGRR